MVRPIALTAAIVVSLLAVSGAGGAGAVDAQTPKRGGTVVFGPIQESACLNPLVEQCFPSLSPFAVMIATLVPGAFASGPDLVPRPVLVSRVTYTRQPPFTLTYKIRRAAEWSDGAPVSARDFVFTYRAVRKYFPDRPESQNIRAVTALDLKTVRVILRSRIADWRGLFSFVLPRHALAGENLWKIWTDRIDNPKTGEPIGSGPFLVERWERGSQITLRRNPRYWGAHPAYLDRLVLRFCRQACMSSEVLEAFRQGQVDVSSSVRNVDIVSDLRRIPGVRVVGAPDVLWQHLDLRRGRGGHPALRSKLVRRALAYGIDRGEIVRQLFGGIDPEYPPSQSAVFLTTSRYYVPNWSRYRYRPPVARSLLRQAGCRLEADSIYSCAGLRLSLRFVTSAGNRVRERGLELMQSQLRRVGIEVVPQYVEGQAFVDQIIPSGDFDAVSFAWFSNGTIGKDVYGCDGPANYSGYCQRLVTKDLDQAERILDARQRARVLNRADRQLARDVPVIPLYQIPFVLAHRAIVRNVVALNSNPFWGVENWWLEH